MKRKQQLNHLNQNRSIDIVWCEDSSKRCWTGRVFGGGISINIFFIRWINKGRVMCWWNNQFLPVNLLLGKGIMIDLFHPPFKQFGASEYQYRISESVNTTNMTLCSITLRVHWVVFAIEPETCVVTVHFFFGGCTRFLWYWCWYFLISKNLIMQTLVSPRRSNW